MFTRFTGRQYLQIDIANSFGLSKKTWDERLAWFEEHQGHLLEMMPQAKEPALFYAGVQAWNQVLRGEPSGYPINLDATASGLQLLACLTGDRSAAELCNVVDMGERMDAYTIVYECMVAQLGEVAKIGREQCKDAIMTALFGSKRVPREVFGSGALLSTFYDTMLKLAPGAWELNETMPQLWQSDALSHDWLLPDNYHVHIRVMARVGENFHFLNKPYTLHREVNAPTRTGRSLGANTIHSIDGMVVREMARRCDHDPKRISYLRRILRRHEPGGYVDEDDFNDWDSQMVLILWGHYLGTGYLSTRILDYLRSHNLDLVDPDVIRDLIDSLPKKPFKILAVHDCFRCLPAYGNDLREQYNLQLALIAKSNILSSVLSQITGRSITIPKADPNLWKDVLAANFALS